MILSFRTLQAPTTSPFDFGIETFRKGSYSCLLLAEPRAMSIVRRGSLLETWTAHCARGPVEVVHVP